MSYSLVFGKFALDLKHVSLYQRVRFSNILDFSENARSDWRQTELIIMGLTKKKTDTEEETDIRLTATT